MSKLPAIQFYPGDWRKDPGVQALDYYERGVWIEMLFLMHESAERGRLLLNGQPMPEEALARILGISPLRVSETVNKILAYGVASVDAQGVIFCRRMVRDEMVRKDQSEAGKQGGNPELSGNYNRPGFLFVMRRDSDGKTRVAIGENPDRRRYKIQSKDKIKIEIIASVPVSDMRNALDRFQNEVTELPDSDWRQVSEEQLKKIKSWSDLPLRESEPLHEDEDEDEEEVVVNSSNSESNQKSANSERELRKVLGKHFDHFWEFWENHCWHKVNKFPSAKAYATVMREGIKPDQINSAADIQGPGLLREAEQNSRSPLYPSTWLTQRRFLDEARPTLFPPSGGGNGKSYGGGKSSWLQSEAEAERAKENASAKNQQRFGYHEARAAV